MYKTDVALCENLPQLPSALLTKYFAAEINHGKSPNYSPCDNSKYSLAGSYITFAIYYFAVNPGKPIKNNLNSEIYNRILVEMKIKVSITTGPIKIWELVFSLGPLQTVRAVKSSESSTSETQRLLSLESFQTFF